MKVLVNDTDGKVLIEQETGMDLFWLGVISSKNTCTTHWEDGMVTGLTMTKHDLIVALGCKRD